MPTKKAWLVAAVVLASSNEGLALNPNFLFERVVDSTIAAPGSDETFALATFAGVSIDGHNVSFNALNSVRGTYAKIEGVLTLIANEDTLMPQGVGTIEFFDHHTSGMENGVVLYRGIHVDPDFDSIYLGTSGGSTVVVDSNTPVPGGSGTIGNKLHSFASLDGARTVFAATTGVYTEEAGAYQVVANLTTLVPGGTGAFKNTAISYPSLSGDNVVFGGRDQLNKDGIYLSRAGSLELIANEQTAIPGIGGTFTDFGRFLDVSGDTVAFLGVGTSGYQAIYTWNGGAFELITDTLSAAPGGVGNFVSLSEWVSIDGEHLAFWGRDSANNLALYTNLPGELTRVVGAGDVLFGGVVHSALITRDGIQNNRIAFEVFFTSGPASHGVYTATYIPELNSLTIALIAAVVFISSVRYVSLRPPSPPCSSPDQSLNPDP